MTSKQDNAIPLTDLAVVAITGADAVSFLQGQLTNDVAALNANTAILAGYCTPKGRLLATLVLWRSSTNPENLFALIKADIAPTVVKRLSMYVLRAKARLTITPLQVYGLNASTQSVEGEGLPESPEPYTVVHASNNSWIAAPRANDAPARWWRVNGTGQWQPEEASGLAPGLSVPADPAIEATDPSAISPRLSEWQAADIAAGLPWTVQSTQDLFIPQTLNMDLIGGVSFTKGCYPGQEVVARSHYRGTVKRRMAYGTAQHASTDPVAPATDIFDANKPGSPVGRVINIAQTDEQLHLLMEVQLADLQTADFRLESADGPAITLQSLPYEIANQGPRSASG